MPIPIACRQSINWTRRLIKPEDSPFISRTTDARAAATKVVRNWMDAVDAAARFDVAVEGAKSGFPVAGPT